MHVHEHLALDDLRRRARAITKRRTWVRFQAVILAVEGRTAAEIARGRDCGERSVQDWVAKDNAAGPDAPEQRPHTGRPPRLAGPDLVRFQQRLEAGPTPEDGICTFHGRDLRLILEREFGVPLGLQAVYDLLHRHGFSSLMPRPQHKDADEDLQAIFREVVADQVQAIREAHPDREIRVWFEDEARFGQQGTLTRVWARRGSRPRGVRQTQYTDLFVLVAVCSATGETSALIMPELNTAVVNLFLEHFARERPAEVHAVLIWDGAGYHTAGALVVPSNVSLIRLPPYSPELNPIENLWHDLRSHDWSNRVYGGYEELMREAIRSLCRVCLEVERMKTVCAADYIARGA